jgi:hypothetical protein
VGVGCSGGVELGRVRGDGSHNTVVELVNVARGDDAGRYVRSYIPGYGIDGHCAGAGDGEEPQEPCCGVREFSRGLLASPDDLIAALDGCASDENPFDIGGKGKSPQITGITSEDGTIRFSQCHAQRIDRRSLPGSTVELGGSTSEGHRHRIFDQAGTDEVVQLCAAPGASL